MGANRANTASWFVVGELHNADGATDGAGTSPPFAIQLHRGHLQIVANYCPTGLNPSNRAQNLTMLTLWTDPKPIQTGRYALLEYRPTFRTAVWVSRWMVSIAQIAMTCYKDSIGHLRRKLLLPISEI
jgi:hypothetical protein